MTQKCSKCSNWFTPDEGQPRLTCPRCRQRAVVYARRYRRKYPASFRFKDRFRVRRYLASGTPKSKLYAKRCEVIRKAANKEWCAANLVARRITAKVLQAVKAGKLIRPQYCQLCGKPKKIVAHEARLENDFPVVRAWLCWKCSWAVKNGEAQLP